MVRKTKTTHLFALCLFANNNIKHTHWGGATEGEKSESRGETKQFFSAWNANCIVYAHFPENEYNIARFKRRFVHEQDFYIVTFISLLFSVYFLLLMILWLYAKPKHFFNVSRLFLVAVPFYCHITSVYCWCNFAKQCCCHLEKYVQILGINRFSTFFFFILRATQHSLNNYITKFEKRERANRKLKWNSNFCFVFFGGCFRWVLAQPSEINTKKESFHEIARWTFWKWINIFFSCPTELFA